MKENCYLTILIPLFSPFEHSGKKTANMSHQIQLLANLLWCSIAVSITEVLGLNPGTGMDFCDHEIQNESRKMTVWQQ